MENVTFLQQAQNFAAEMVELIKVYEDGDEPDERYIAFTKELSSRIIAETSTSMSHQQYNDAFAALRLVAQIKDFHEREFHGAITCHLDDAILHVMHPTNTLKFLVEEGVDEHKEIILNGVSITIRDAIKIFKVFNALAASVSHGIFYNGIYNNDWDGHILSDSIGYNPIQRLKG